MNTMKTTETTLEIVSRNNAYAPLAWVCKAISKDPTREILHAVELSHNEEKDTLTIVGTDGCRLHKAEFPLHAYGDFFPAGQYLPRVTAKQITLTRREGWNFPDWKMVIPDYSARDGKTLKGKYRASVGLVTLVSGFVARINSMARLNNNETEFVFNDQYLAEILGIKSLLSKKHGGQDWEFTAREESALVLTGEKQGATLYGLLMPFRFTR